MMEYKDYTTQLTEPERQSLEAARAYGNEKDALERYCELWMELDRRLGVENELVKEIVYEYKERSFPPARDRQEERKVSLMKSMYVIQHLYPPDVAAELRLFDIYRNMKDK